MLPKSPRYCSFCGHEIHRFHVFTVISVPQENKVSKNIRTNKLLLTSGRRRSRQNQANRASTTALSITRRFIISLLT
uniref:Uncharacterized protein n=1 Tax=Rhizophora mucronata TaxID=61149 RepID=A0A2P2Q8X5_RHIMU